MSKILKSESFYVSLSGDKPVNRDFGSFTAPENRAMEQALSKAKLICQEAERRSLELIESAERDCSHILVEAEQRGYREGYAQGVRDGALEARRTTEQDLLEMSALLNDMRTMKRQFAEDHKEDLVTIAFEIARKIMRQHVDADAQAMERMIESIIEDHETGVRIYLSEYSSTLEAQVDRTIAKKLSDRAAGTRVIITQHDDLLMVETDDGVTDMSLPTQMQQLKAAAEDR